jgi:hypothetical protein
VGTALDGPVRVREGIGFQRRLDHGAHGVEVDPDGRERVPVKAAEQAGPGPVTGMTDDLLLNALRRYAVLAQDGARRQTGRDQGKQEVLAADVTVAEPAGMLQARVRTATASGVPGSITASRPGCRASQVPVS